MTAEERFWPKVDASGDCWLWTGARKPTGYGNFWSGERYVLAHRFAYEALVGEIAEGLTIDHLCRVRSCVNPDHMEPVPWEENNRRGHTIAARNAAKTRCPRGHEYDYRSPRGVRRCTTCDRVLERQRKDTHGSQLAA